MITIKDQDTITDKTLKKILKPKILKDFNEWLTGQTCPLNGVWEWDFLKWLNQQ